MQGEPFKRFGGMWAAAIGLSLLATAAGAADYSGGEGTKPDPYKISRLDDWTTLTSTTDDWDRFFVLTTDLDFAGASVMPVGSEFIPFTGFFAGTGHVLRDFTINLPETDDVGLFGFIGAGGVILQLGVKSAVVTGYNNVGALAGCNEYLGRIEDCYTTGRVTGHNRVGGLVGRCGLLKYCRSACTVTGNTQIGGLAGYIAYAPMQACCATGMVTGSTSTGGLLGHNKDGDIEFCYARGAVAGSSGIGGLVGFNTDGSLKNCYAAGTVFGTDKVGGLVGHIELSYIKSCYAIGAVSGDTDTGGLVGLNDTVTVEASYWDMNTSGQVVSAGGEGRTTGAMTWSYGATTFVDWDFTEVWAADTDYSINKGYPYLLENVPVPEQFHPADVNLDWRMEMSEAIAYIVGWQNGVNPMAYAIRAAFLWQNGENYFYDGEEDPPLCWILTL